MALHESDGLYMVAMSLPDSRPFVCTGEFVVSRLVQCLAPRDHEAIHIELVYVVTCPGPLPGNRLCDFAQSCRIIRMDCEGCGEVQVVSDTECPNCEEVPRFACWGGARHAIVISSRKYGRAWDNTRSKCISGVDVQLDRALIRGADRLNHWDSYLTTERTSVVDRFILSFCREVTDIVHGEPGVNRYNYMSVFLSMCQLISNPTSYLGRGNPACRMCQGCLWVSCCCICDTSNPYFPSADEAMRMTVAELARECFTCATLVHVVLLRLRLVNLGEGGITFGSVHPGELVAVARSRHWHLGLLHGLISRMS